MTLRTRLIEAGSIAGYNRGHRDDQAWFEATDSAKSEMTKMQTAALDAALALLEAEGLQIRPIKPTFRMETIGVRARAVQESTGHIDTSWLYEEMNRAYLNPLEEPNDG